MRTGPLTKEHKRKISETMLGRRLSLNHRLAIGNGKRGVPLSEKNKKSLSSALLGRPQSEKHRQACKDSWIEPSNKRITQLHSAQKAAVNVTSNTKPEVFISEYLESRRIKFAQQVSIGKYFVDFLVGKTIIEVFGCYWHACQECGFEDNGEIKYDRERVDFLQSLGFRIKIVWEHTINAFRR